MVPVTPGAIVKVVLLIDEVFIASLKVAVMTAREHTPVAPLAGVTEITVGGGLHPLAAVVKLQTESLASPLPKVSWAPVVRVAVYTVLIVRGLDGGKVKIVVLTSWVVEIGRASGRGRVEVLVGGGFLE